MDVTDQDTVLLDGRRIVSTVEKMTILFNKPRGYVVSRGHPVRDRLPVESAAQLAGFLRRRPRRRRAGRTRPARARP